MLENSELFERNAPDYTNGANVMFIHSNMYQNVVFSKEYPALILVHLEHPAMNMPLHWHPEPELIYSRNKKITVIIDENRIELGPGEFVLISSFALHAVEPDEDEIHQDVMSITFQSGYLERMLPEMLKYTISHRAQNATDESRQRMSELLENLRDHLEPKRDYFFINMILFSILQLMYEDFRDGLQEGDLKQLDTRNKVVEILEYVKKNYRQTLTTQSVAEHFGYTREYFCRIFSRYGNHTFKQYLTEIRLTAAVQELVISNRGVGVIAMEHGFPSEKSFFSAFKKKYHMTPVQYRKSYNKDERRKRL